MMVHLTEHLFSVSPRKHYILFSTGSPPAVQRIPWPIYDETEAGEQTARRSLTGHDTWMLNDHELPWLVDPDGKSLFYDLPNVTHKYRSHCYADTSLNWSGNLGNVGRESILCPLARK
jgi:hypothetical protein